MHSFNSILFKEIRVFNRKVLLADLLWFVLGIASILAQVLKNSFNNYLIFRGVFWHLVHEQNLYGVYPSEYFDINHYGPVFALVVAPFAILPVKLGVFLWGLANCWFLYYAIKRLPFEKNAKTLIIWICLLEQLTALHNLQFNHATTALIILTYVFVEKKKDFWATLCIFLGVAIKLYGIVGLAFFFMSDRKVLFILSSIFWCLVLFCLPMLISSPAYIIGTYKDWYTALVEKNQENTSAAVTMQDISVGGMIKRISRNYQFNDMIVMVAAAIVLLFEMAVAFFSNTKKIWALMLASLLLSIVLFSSSSESATYIIALAGVGIWFVVSVTTQPLISRILIALVIFFTSVCSTDLVPHYIKSHYIIGYSLKALPCLLVWLFIVIQVAGMVMHKKDRLPAKVALQ